MESVYEYGFEAGPEFMIFYLICMLLMSLFSIASYVLRNLGVYTIAKRRGIKRSWLRGSRFWISICWAVFPTSTSTWSRERTGISGRCFCG